jgi:hypothetical protein
MEHVRMLERTGRMRIGLLVCAAVLAWSTAEAAEFRVNSSTLLPCSNATVGMDRLGNFVVAWEYQTSIGIQRFGLDGARQGAEEVWPGHEDPKFRPSVARNASGNYIISWKERTTEDAVWVQLFDHTGNPLHAATQVSSSLADYDPYHHSIIAPQGNFAVTWTQWNDPSSNYVYVRRYDSGGGEITPDLVVSVGFNSVGAYDSYGNLMLAWTDGDIPGGMDVYLRGYDADGMPHGGPRRVGTGGQGRYLPSVACNGEMFMAAWVEENSDGNGTGIYARRFDETGEPIGHKFLVNTTIYGDQLFPRVASSPTSQGDFLITWQGPQGGGCEDTQVFARRFDAAGYPIDDEILVSEFGTDIWPTPAAAMDDSGNFVIVWEALAHLEGEVGGTVNIYAKRYDYTGEESGDEPFTAKVPEPVTILLLVPGLAALALAKRKRRRTSDGPYGPRAWTGGV